MATQIRPPQNFASETIETTQPDPLRSAEIGKLADALCKAQSAILAPKKDRTADVETRDGKGYAYNYADLAGVIECYRQPLVDNGLAITQPIRERDGHMVLLTLLLHTSGQWIGSEYPIANFARPQEQGSAITYARRYAVSALLGLAAEDDDGAAAQNAKKERKREADPTSAANADASAILDLAAELQQIDGRMIPAIVKAASHFVDDKGKERFFEDPLTVLDRPKWLNSTRKRLEGELTKLRERNEPGAREAAKLFK